MYFKRKYLCNAGKLIKTPDGFANYHTFTSRKQAYLYLKRNPKADQVDCRGHLGNRRHPKAYCLYYRDFNLRKPTIVNQGKLR